MAVELKRTAAILKDKGDEVLSQTLERWSQTITNGIWDHGIVNHAKYGQVFAYEVDGYGSTIMMDDANYPSLLALPLMGFVPADDQTYQNTRKMLLEKSSNPYYLIGRQFKGIGGEFIIAPGQPISLLLTENPQDLTLGSRTPGR